MISQLSNNVLAAQAITAALLAMLLDWVPQFRKGWDPLPENKKRLYMGIALAVILVIIALADCFLNGHCPSDWVEYVVDLIAIYVVGVGVNQGTHSLGKPAEPIR